MSDPVIYLLPDGHPSREAPCTISTCRRTATHYAMTTRTYRDQRTTRVTRYYCDRDAAEWCAKRGLTVTGRIAAELGR